MESHMCMADVIGIVTDMLCHIADGRATSVTADFIANCGRWNSHVLEWLILLP